MSGMPAWRDHSGEEVWVIVAFIEKLPGMSEEEYRALVMRSIMGGGRHDHGGMGDAKPDAMLPSTP